MKFIRDFFKAISTCFKSINTIFQKGLWPYFLYPVLFWIIVLITSFWIFADIANNISDYLNTYFNFKNIPDSGSWLSSLKPFLTTYFSFILAIVLKLIFWYVVSTLSKYLILIFLSPLFALLSESTEEKLYGNKYPFSFSQLLKDIARGIGISLRNMFFEYSIILICFFLTIVFPPLAIIITPFLFLVSWYFIGFTLLDYNFERHKMNIKESTQFIRKNIGIACGLGITYFGFMLLPFFVGLMLAPVITIVAGTILFLEIKNQEKTVIA